MVKIARVSNENELEAIRLLQIENLRVLIGEVFFFFLGF